jgi:hypothetical protein
MYTSAHSDHARNSENMIAIPSFLSD